MYQQQVVERLESQGHQKQLRDLARSTNIISS